MLRFFSQKELSFVSSYKKGTRCDFIYKKLCDILGWGLKILLVKQARDRPILEVKVRYHDYMLLIWTQVVSPMEMARNIITQGTILYINENITKLVH